MQKAAQPFSLPAEWDCIMFSFSSQERKVTEGKRLEATLFYYTKLIRLTGSSLWHVQLTLSLLCELPWLADLSASVRVFVAEQAVTLTHVSEHHFPLA